MVITLHFVGAEKISVEKFAFLMSKFQHKINDYTIFFCNGTGILIQCACSKKVKFGKVVLQFKNGKTEMYEGMKL